MKTRYKILLLGTILALLILAVTAPLRVFILATMLVSVIAVIVVTWVNDMVKQDVSLSKRENDKYNNELVKGLGLDE